MDSMRNLHSSLPRTRRTVSRQPTAELLAAFKSAALSVTQLYKSASADQEAARAAGYQDALDDLLELLDAENMGLGDGEGWRVRQWATERLTPATAYASENEMDADKERSERDTSAGPAQGQPQASTAPSGRPASETQQKPEGQSQPQTQTMDSSPVDAHEKEVFSFRSNHCMPSAIDTATTLQQTLTENPNIFSNFHLQVIPNRTHRHSNKHTSPHRQRSSPSAPTLNTALGHGAGAKRKANFADFFDMSGIARDGDTGPKRGRHA